MALKGNTRKTYRTMRGRTVDMDLLQQRNELTPAVGNARVNARGDEFGPGGKIIRKKEQAVKDYYKAEPRKVAEPVQDTPLEAKAKSKTGVKSNTTTRAQQKVESSEPSARELDELENDWVEDDDGNFVPKGE
jgi:hypothetical protein